MIRPIVLYNAPVLREKAQPVLLSSPHLSALIQDMWDTMYQARGVGLAAPQIGYSLALFVVDATPFADEFSDQPEVAHFKQVFLNPEIVEWSKEQWEFEEGCLSIPNVRAIVTRPKQITIRFYDEKLSLRTETYSGIIARIIQHEYDHLQGVLFIDRIAPAQKQALLPKLKRIQKGKVDTAYPVIPAKKAPFYQTLSPSYGSGHSA